MTTLARPDPRTDGGPKAAHPKQGGRRYAEWRASWAVALRMARRDVRRHRGRSALVVVMVAVPTLLLSVLVTVAATSDVSGTELIGPSMGNGQALLEGPSAGRVLQGASPGEASAGVETEALPVMGLDPAAGAFANADAVGRLVGAPVVPTTWHPVRITLGERRLTIDTRVLDGREDLGAKLTLESGRWPQGTGEALVTAYGLGRGVPGSGTMALTAAGEEHRVTVVGVGRLLSHWGAEGLVMAEPLVDTPGNGGWIVRGDDPVTWPEVQELNAHGLRVTSAAVLRDPPSEDELPAELRGMVGGGAEQLRAVTALGAVMLLVTTALLVGPAFAVSAARQRRTLALAASNGASTPVLRRTVLGQALVLGTVSSVLGVVLGVAVARGLVAWTMREGAGIAGAFDVRWMVLMAIAGCAVASTLVAALAPARRLGRLDIVGVMRGQSVSPPPSRGLFLGGLLLAGIGALLILAGTGVVSVPALAILGQRPGGGGGEVPVTLGAVVLILGALFTVPVLLTLVGRMGSRMPSALRMAARDLARHRSRSAPSVAAVLAAVAGLTFGLTGLASDTEQREEEYLPQTIDGEVLVLPGWDAPLGVAQVAAAAAGLVVSENLTVDTNDPWMEGEQPTEPFQSTFVNLVPPQCTPEQTVIFPFAEGPTGPSPEACMVAGTNGVNGGTVVLLPADEAVRRLGLDTAQEALLRGGGVVVGRVPPIVTAAGTARLARGTYVTDPQATGPTDPELEVSQDVTVPVIAMPQTKETAGRMLQGSMLLATDTATTRNWPTRTGSVTVRSASGAAVSDETVEKLQQSLGDDVGVVVERGFQREDRLVVGILLGVFALLILVITLTSTALTLAEQQTDQATLAALGATRGTRRVMAAAQAFLLAVVGCLLGVAVGLVPGIAVSRPLTIDGWDPVTQAPSAVSGSLAIPWVEIGVVALVVPLVAAVIAAVGIRRAPQVTRRAT